MGYQHTQHAPLYLLLIFFGLLMLGTVAALPELWLQILMAMSGSLMLLLSLSFRTLTVQDEGDHLRIAFGPLPLFQRRIAYRDMIRAQRGRSTLLDGWGIHLSPRGGWTWNLWGFGCVDIDLQKGQRVRIGTDEPDRLEAYLQTRIAERSGRNQ